LASALLLALEMTRLSESTSLLAWNCLRRTPHTDQIVLIGGPGGDSELKAATYIMEKMTKPVIAYLVGENLATSILRPFFSRSGSLSLEALGSKTDALKDAGVRMAGKLSDIPALIKR